MVVCLISAIIHQNDDILWDKLRLIFFFSFSSSSSSSSSFFFFFEFPAAVVIEFDWSTWWMDTRAWSRHFCGKKTCCVDCCFCGWEQIFVEQWYHRTQKKLFLCQMMIWQKWFQHRISLIRSGNRKHDSHAEARCDLESWWSPNGIGSIFT